MQVGEKYVYKKQTSNVCKKFLSFLGHIFDYYIDIKIN